QRTLEAQVSQLEAQVSQLEAQVSQLEAQVSQLEAQVSQLEAQNQRLRWAEERLAAIESGPGWQLLAKLWPLRRTLIPPGSFRENLFKQFVAKLTGSRIVSDLSATGHQFSLMSAQPFQASQTQESISSCHKPTTPRLALVVLAAPQDLSPVTDWIESQTWKPDVLIFYDPSKAQVYDPQTGISISESFFSSVEGLDVRYVGFVTPAHAKLRRTFVEENIIALEGEGLAFTANYSSAAIANGEIRSLPGALAFVYKDRLFCDANGQLMLHISDMGNRAVGKFIASSPLSSNKSAILEIGLDSSITVRGAYATANSIHSAVVSLCPLDHLCSEAARLNQGRPVVILVMPFIAVGGAERVALDMIRVLQPEIEFVVVATDMRPPDAGSMVDSFQQVVSRTYILENFLHPELRLSFFRYLIKALSPQTLYVANGSIWIYNQLLPALKQEFPSLRVVNQVYDHIFGWIEHYNSSLIRLIDAHIGPNQHICDEYARRGVPKKNIFLVEHGIDTSEFDPSRYTLAKIAHLRQKLGIPEEKRVITFIGRFHPQKRPMDFVELARSLSEDKGLFFLMVGDGPLSKVVDSEIQRIGLTNLRRLSFYQPSRDIFAISDLIVLPSEYEGMPLVILEAQAMGKPVVATDVGNNREVLSITGGGLIVPHIGNTRELRRAVKEALENPVDPVRLRQAVQSHFELRLMAQKYRAALLGYSA
ncbi:MAG: glycosyltransferase, partial [Candidatus Caldarchaeum sp.]